MPYYTRGMVQYMQTGQQSQSNMGSCSSAVSSVSSAASSNVPSYHPDMTNATEKTNPATKISISTAGATNAAAPSTATTSATSPTAPPTAITSAAAPTAAASPADPHTATTPAAPTSASSPAAPPTAITSAAPPTPVSSPACPPSSRAPQSSPNRPKRALRITPSCVDADATAAVVSKFDIAKQKEGMTFDDKRLLYMKNLLRLQVGRIQRMESSLPITNKAYAKYEFDVTAPLNDGNQYRMYRAKRRDFPDVAMVLKLYDNISVSVKNPFFLRILRHLGKKHPFIVQTWDVFIDNIGRILIVQEFANRNDVGTYLAKNGPQNEALVSEWSRQLYKALDYLGDMAICHRNLKPRRVLLIHRETSIRLTGFYDAVIYWNPIKEDILNFPCIPLANKNRETPDFQAPEVHGDPNKEEFDPIAADVWSYGAVVYFMITQSYPYNFTVDNRNLESEIQQNVNRLPISDEGKQFLRPLLNTNAIIRQSFERVSQKWFNKFQKNAPIGSYRKN